MDLLTITELRQSARGTPVEAAMRVQLESSTVRQTREGKDFHVLEFCDGSARFSLRVWSDASIFPRIGKEMVPRRFYELQGKWSENPKFGLEAIHWDFRVLEEKERRALLEVGSGEQQENDYRFIESQVVAMTDPRLQLLGRLFLERHGERFRRTAAAREYHHARRGGLVEHVAQMMRSALALAGAYPEINGDLLLAGVLFHDCGKLWENAYEEEGFRMPVSEAGELLGHITIGTEIINRLWRDLLDQHNASWIALEPPSNDVRVHLLHLVASHHGTHEFGSPVLPKTPEAVLLHFIDNIDAKMEMFREGYLQAEPLAKRVMKRVRPLPANLVSPLPTFETGPEPDSGTGSSDEVPHETRDEDSERPPISLATESSLETEKTPTADEPNRD